MRAIAADISHALIDALEAAGYEPRSYSGRGMYGKVCVGVTLNNDQSVWSLALEIARNLEDPDYVSSLPVPKEDSMGLGTIVYWPSLPWPEKEEEEEEED